MLASSFGDPVLGIDIHWEMVPMPAPVPTPIPNPFTGIIFDPIGLAAGLVISNAVGAVLGAPFTGPVVYWTAVPATNTGTEAKHLPGHILIPPGTAWAPVPKTPKPVIHPGETPSPPKPVSPENDAVCVFGSKTVSVMGSNAVRLGDMAMSCSEPVRLPSSVVLAVPKGAPILIGGPPSLDLMAAILASLRTRFVSDSLHALISRMRPSRFRNFLNRAVCFFTGHPVDVASGKVMTHLVDAELPGPLPLKIERVYSSAFASRSGPLGHGWSHSLHQSIWRERGKVVYLAEDGREIEFDTFDFPDHRIRPGEELWHPIDRLTLRCKEGDRWEIEGHDGIVREFAPVPGSGGVRSLIQRIRSRCRFHEILFEYDERGCLRWVRDSGGRLINLEHDEEDRLVVLKLPVPEGRGWYVHRRYEYDRQGDLVRVTDALGAFWSFEYATHLLTRETDRTGLSFFFVYDGFGEDAWCVRTWGDGGIYDHVLDYDKKNHITYVTNSLSHTTQYHMNVAGQVTKIVDPLGGETKYEYDPGTLQRTAQTDPLGHSIKKFFDERGRLTRYQDPMEATVTIEYDQTFNQPIRSIDPNGGEWIWTYDRLGRLSGRRDPVGRWTHYEYEKGFLHQLKTTRGAATELRRDDYGNVIEFRNALEGVTQIRYDHLGSIDRLCDARGAVQRRFYDLEGRLVRLEEPGGTTQLFVRNAEGRIVEAKNQSRSIRFEYSGFHSLASKIENGASVRFHYNTENQLIAIENEAGENYQFQLDGRGFVRSEVGFDGHVHSYLRDAGGKIVTVTKPSGRTTEFSYDGAGRISAAKHSDGATESYRYRMDGALLEAKNNDCSVRFQRDPLGRILRESLEGDWVASAYGSDGTRSYVGSSRGFSEHLERNLLGNLDKLEVASEDCPWRVGFSRDKEGIELERAFPGGVRTVWERDKMGRSSARAIYKGGEATHERRYRWNLDNRIDSILDSHRGSTRFDYDRRGRLIGTELPDGQYQNRFIDEVGNIFRTPSRKDRRYGAGGRVEEYDGFYCEHDPDGNLIRKTAPDGQVTEYLWNGAGRLKEVSLPDGSKVAFAYDCLGRRTRKTVSRKDAVLSETNWIWDGPVPLHEERSGEEPITWIFEPESFVPLGKLQGNRRWSILTDPSGTPTEMRNEAGELAWKMNLDAWGLSRASEIETDCPFRWPGQTEDIETGLHYNRFRYYDHTLGSFISADPLLIRGGMRMFAYVADPIATSDPLGLMDPWDICFSQTSIGDTFLNGPWAGRTLEEAIEETRLLGRLPDGLELNVMMLNDQWVTLNNRTLFVAQEAGLPHVHPTDAGPGGWNQMNKLLDGGMPLPAGEQPEVRRSCG